MNKNKSFWIDNFEIDNYEELKENIKTEVCIIGGGITGISTAYYLAKNGIEVAILEKDYIGSKTTGATTGKITTQHGLFYNYLLQSNGEKFARKYAKSNFEAFNNIKEIIENEHIDCDYEIRDSIVYSTNPKYYKMLQKETEVCKVLDIDAEFLQKIDLPIMIHGGVKFKNQAQFNSIKYIDGLCKAMIKNGVSIYENTKAISYDKKDSLFIIKVQTEKGNFEVKAEKLVVTTRYPIFNVPGMYFIKSYQELEYAMCVELKDNIESLDMYLNIDKPNVSFRTALLDNKRYLLTVGNGAKTGEKIDINEYNVLKDNIEKIFGEYKIINKWVAEDVISLDKIPYIGKYTNFEKNMYVATGFKKWGMTTSNVAAKIISDMIIGQSNKYAEIYTSTRVNPIKNIDEMKNMTETTCKSLLNKKKGDKICTHLGCKTVFNKTTNTWDCPCHGSRYENDGTLIDGPSIKDLKTK